MPNKPTFGAQIDATIESFLRAICDYVELRHHADPNDYVRRPTNSQLIREMCIHSKPKAIVDSLYPPPRVQITDNQEGQSCADTPINHPSVPDVPTVQHEEPPTSADNNPMAPVVVVDHLCPLPGPTMFPEPKPPVNITPAPTPITTRRRHLRNTLIFGLCLSALILALSANRDTEGGSALAKENEQLHARLAAIDAAAQDQAAKAVKDTTASNTPGGTAKPAVESTIDDALIGELRVAKIDMQDWLNLWPAAKTAINARLDANAKTIADLSREIAELKSAHARIGPEVAGNPIEARNDQP